LTWSDEVSSARSEKEFKGRQDSDWTEKTIKISKGALSVVICAASYLMLLGTSAESTVSLRKNKSKAEYRTEFQAAFGY
jgi:hypothetical protein